MNAANENLLELSQRARTCIESARPAPLQRKVAEAARGVFEAWENSAQTQIQSRVARLESTLDSWEACVAAQFDYLRYRGVVHEVAPFRRTRSGLWRAARDVSRWSRKLVEGADIDLRKSRSSTGFAAFVDGVVAHCDGLGTFTTDFEIDVYLPEAGDSLTMRMRKAIARRSGVVREQAPRAVPMAMLARHYLLPTTLEVATDAHNRLEGVVAAFWRRAFHATREMQGLFDGLSRVVEAGEGEVNWESLDQERRDLFTGLREDLRRHADEIRIRAMSALTHALQLFVSGSMRSGTFLLPRRRYEPSPDAAERELHHEKLRTHNAAWVRVTRAVAQATALQLDAQAFAAAVRFAHLRDAAELSELFDTRLLGPAELVYDQATGLLPLLSGSAPLEAARAILCKTPDGETFALHHHVESGVLRELSDSRSRELFVDCITELRRSVGRAASRVGVSYQVVQPTEIPMNEGARAPNPPLHDVPNRTMAADLVMSQVNRNIETSTALLANTLDRAQDLTLEILRALDFNFEAAVAELSSEHDDDERANAQACTYAKAGLQRMHEKVHALMELGDKRRSELLGTMDEAVDDALDQYLARVRELSTDHRARSRAFTDQQIGTAVGTAEESSTDKLWKRSRLCGSADEVALLLRDASFSRFAHSELPESYRRLFISDDRSDALFDVGLERSLSGFRDAISSWEAGELESVALVGVRGVGKSNVFRQVQARLAADFPSHHMTVRDRVLDEPAMAAMLAKALNLPTASRMSEVEERLLQRHDRMVMYIEGGERLFLRHPDGLDGIRALMSLMHATGERVLWLVSFEQAAFDFLQRVLNISESFTTVVAAPMLDRSELERFILLRHDVSGIALHWEAVDSRRDDVKLQIGRFFDEFHTASQGYPPLAVYLWLRCLRPTASGDAFAVSRPLSLPEGLLQSIDGQRLAALATVLLHGGLRLDEFARAIRLPRADATAVLGQLRHAHLVEGAQNSPRGFTVNRVAFWQLYTELRDRHLL